jgi:hypothetical protein
MITIDGIEYTEDQLSDSQKYMVAQVQDIDDKIGKVRFQLDQLHVAKQGFSDLLVNSFKSEDE